MPSLEWVEAKIGIVSYRRYAPVVHIFIEVRNHAIHSRLLGLIADDLGLTGDFYDDGETYCGRGKYLRFVIGTVGGDLDEVTCEVCLNRWRVLESQ